MGISLCTGPSVTWGVTGYIAGWGGGMSGEPNGSSISVVDVDECSQVEHLVGKDTNTQLKYSLYWLLLGLVTSVVQHEEVMSRLQNAFLKSKLLKWIDSAMDCSEEVAFRVFHHSLHKQFKWNHNQLITMSSSWFKHLAKQKVSAGKIQLRQLCTAK